MDSGHATPVHRHASKSAQEVEKTFLVAQPYALTTMLPHRKPAGNGAKRPPPKGGQLPVPNSKQSGVSSWSMKLCSRLGDEWQIGTVGFLFVVLVIFSTSIREDHLIASGLRVVQWYHASVNVDALLLAIIQKITLPCNVQFIFFCLSRRLAMILSIWNFFPRVRTPCGHGAQVIVEGRESQSDGGEKNTDHKQQKTNRTQNQKGPQAASPPSCSLSSVLGETGETRKSVKKGLN